MVDPQLDEFYITIMSKINEQLQTLRLSVEDIKKNMDKIEMENSLLKKQQEDLVSEKAELVKKNELAKTEIQSMLDRIKNIEID
tara:strand:+ start:225 stop:476 length:252 start_codon:yes stop_codon:yes gene_type:complete